MPDQPYAPLGIERHSGLTPIDPYLFGVEEK